MFFIVPPDDDVESEDDLNPAPAPKPSNAKVELDLDDAPFLEEEKEPEPEPEPEKTNGPAATAEAAPASGLKGKLAALKAKLLALVESKLGRFSPKQRKFILLGILALVVLLISLPIVFILLSPPKAPAPPPVAAPVVEPQRIVVPSTPPELAAPVPFAHLYKLDPFWVEKRGTDGEVRFLTCRLTLPTNDPMLFSEFSAKLLTIRDSLYYYLYNRPVSLIDSPLKEKLLREDLISVLNEHLASGKLTEIYIEDYFVSTP